MQAKRTANFSYLLGGLLCILVAGPVVHEFTDQPMTLITQLAFTGTLIISIWSLIDSRRWFIAGIVLAGTDIVVTAIAIRTELPFAENLTLIIGLAFCSMSLVFTMHHVLIGRNVDLNRIIGAVCVYLLLGVTLALLNMLVFRFVPDSFRGLSAPADGTQGLDLLYYSFVTMSTLGYGDITPTGPLARVLAYLAAILGQFYIAILIGMLVGLYLSQDREPATKD